MTFTRSCLALDLPCHEISWDKASSLNGNVTSLAADQPSINYCWKFVHHSVCKASAERSNGVFRNGGFLAKPGQFA